MSPSTWLRLVTLGFLAVGSVHSVKLSKHAQQMSDESMSFLDEIYDSNAGYLNYFYYPLAAGPHETRSSVWYATGLLQRNCGTDVTEAVKILRNVIGGQEKNSSVLWYGDYTVYPEQPTVGSAAYPPVVCPPRLPFLSFTPMPNNALSGRLHINMPYNLLILR